MRCKILRIERFQCIVFLKEIMSKFFSYRSLFLFIAYYDIKGVKVMNFASVIILGLIGEALWETLKLVWQNGKISVDRIGTILIGVLLAVGTGLDLMDIIGIPIKIPYIGVLLTGLLLSRGANFLHDIFDSVKNLHLTTKNNAKDTGESKRTDNSHEDKGPVK
jgi:hypothetical protein